MINTNISFVHAGIPDCISPIVTSFPDYPEYFFIGGTGFIAKKRNKLFFFTARHCLTKDIEADIGEIASRLHVPYMLSGTKTSPNDYVQFSDIYTFKHSDPDIPGDLVDIVMLVVDVKEGSKEQELLLQRAVSLPPTGDWFDNFMRASIVKDMISNGGRIPVLAIGYPLEETQTRASIEEGIVSQSVKIAGSLLPGKYPHTMSMNDISWEHDLNGMSGSPVFSISQQALVGMIVYGGNQQAQFIRISQIGLSHFNPPLGI